MFCRPTSIMISKSLLCLLAVLLLVVCCLLQLISGRLKSPAMTTFGGFCVLYSFVRGSCKASSHWRWSLGGSVVGGKVNGFISCKMNFCSDGVIVG